MARIARWLSLALVASCGGGGESSSDASIIDPPRCEGGCDDGLFCNGVERCEPGSGDADERGCVAGTEPCSGDCDDVEDVCGAACDDADNDGYPDIACGGTDCDDTDRNRFPGNTEVCDPDDRDEDCDPTTYGIRDLDMDGFPDARCCNGADDARVCGTDCDDTLAIAHPGEAESCDGNDNDCDGNVDELVLVTYTIDDDRDGHGDMSDGAATMAACFRPAGYAESADDCDDANGDINPGTPERCDEAGLDENCDGEANPAALCSCVGDAERRCEVGELYGICASGVQLCTEGTWSSCSIAPQAETCDNVDNDCDNSIDEGVTIDCYPDGDNDGYPAAGAILAERCSDGSRPSVGGCPPGFTNRVPEAPNLDCDDGESAVRPSATEICNGINDDCDASVDEMLTVVCYADTDNDTYPRAGAGRANRCPDAGRGLVGGCPTGFTNRAPGAGTADCEDGISTINPGVPEDCATPDIDENCNGAAHSVDCSCTSGATRSCGAGGFQGACAAGMQQCAGGEWPETCSIMPSLEVCNGTDDDCNGIVDDGAGFVCAAGQSQRCTTGCDSPGTQTCNASCTAFGTCLGPEVCNGCDDDGSGGADDGFDCVQGAPGEACTTLCLTAGTGTCNESCTGVIASSCNAATETCNYCDDDGDGSIRDENGTRDDSIFMTTRLTRVNYLLRGSAAIQSELAWRLTPDSGSELRGGVWWDGPFGSSISAGQPDTPIMGHGPYEVGVLIDCNGTDADPSSADSLKDQPAFAIVLATGGESTIQSVSGANGQNAGVPSGMTGLRVRLAPYLAYETPGRSLVLETASGSRIQRVNFTPNVLCSEGDGFDRATLYVYYNPRLDTPGAQDEVVITGSRCTTPRTTCTSEYMRAEIPVAQRIEAGTLVQVGYFAFSGDDNRRILARSLSSMMSYITYANDQCASDYPSNGDLRIVGDRGAGRLEIFQSARWGTVCADSFGNVDADVACRQMGYDSGVSLGTSVPDGVGPVWMDDLRCTGAETALRNCSFPGFGVENCDHTDDVGVQCSLD